MPALLLVDSTKMILTTPSSQYLLIYLVRTLTCFAPTTCRIDVFGHENCPSIINTYARYGISTGHRGAPGALTIGQHQGRTAPVGRVFPVSGTGSRKHNWRGTTRIVRAGSPSYIHMHYIHPMRNGTILHGSTLFHHTTT